MPTDLREQALAAHYTWLQGVSTTPAVAFFARNLPYTLGTLQRPSVVQYDGRDEIVSRQSGIINIATEVMVEVTAQAASPSAIGPASNLLSAEIIKRMVQQPWLGTTPPGVYEVEFRGLDGPVLDDESGPPIAVTMLTFAILREQREDDPFSAG